MFVYETEFGFQKSYWFGLCCYQSFFDFLGELIKKNFFILQGTQISSVCLKQSQKSLQAQPAG